MKEITTLSPFCYPLDMKVDINLLLDSVSILLTRLGLNLAEINKLCETRHTFSMNLTHLPEMRGEDRWKNHAALHGELKKRGVCESNFTEHLLESQDLLIGKLIHEIYEQHPGKFQGRAQLAWLGPNNGYPLHRDLHTPHRYHVPLITNEKCFWLLKNKEEVFKLHMPADGRVWYLDPTNIEHTVRNESDTSRLHLLLTSSF
jgi:hypothetical protein